MVPGSQASWGMIMINGLKGNLEYEKGNYAGSRRFLKNAYANIAVISNAYQQVKYILLGLGKTESKLGNHAEAILYFREVANLAVRGRSYQHLLETFHFLSESFSATNQPDSALYYFRSYAQLKDSLLAIKRQEIVLSVSEKYEAEKKSHQIELLEKEKLLFDYELRMKNEEIENQALLSIKDAQQIELLAKQNEISRLNASEKALALVNREKEIEEKKKELTLMGKEKELQRVIAGKAGQQRKFALLTTLGVLLVSVYGFFRYRQNKKLGQQLALSLEELKQAQEQLIRIEREKEAENVRSRISRDIHDEVGATLSGVALFSQIAKQKMEQHRQEDAREYLEHISANSKEMVEKMSDIVWAINPQNDNLDRLVSKLRAYAVNLCAGKGIHFHLHVDETALSHIPSMQDRKNIYLLVKEAINNAVKYSGGTNIWLRLEKENEAVLLMVKDDGNGFDKHVTASGNGLANMQVRAKELDALFTIDAQPGRGTIIQLRLYFHPAGGQQPIV
jgi:signal transduction histidine kinase